MLQALDLLSESDKILSYPGNGQAEILRYLGLRLPQIVQRFLPFAVLLGTPLGIWLFTHAPGGLSPSPRLHRVVDAAVSMLRSFPFLILLIAIIPVTRLIVGTTIGTAAVIVVGEKPFSLDS